MKSKKITITIVLGNEAMRTGADVAGILRELADKAERVDRFDSGPEDFGATARDANGNHVATMVAS